MIRFQINAFIVTLATYIAIRGLGLVLTGGRSMYGLPDDYFTTFVPKVLSIDASDVTRAAQEHIDPARLLTVIVGDRDTVGPTLGVLNLGEAADVAVA